MDGKRYQVFISSTFTDLVSEREQVIKQILTLGHIPVGMEMFSADDEEQWGIIQREIDRSDYYLVIIKQRYGSVIKSEGNISFTEKEYDYAGSIGVPRLGFIINDDVEVLPKYMESSANLKKKLENFKSKAKGRPVSFFRTPDDLGIQVLQALTKQIARGGRPGWERSTEGAREVLNSFVKISNENVELREELARLRELVGDKVPAIDCHFIDVEGKRLGNTLSIVRPKDILPKLFAKNYLSRINSLVSNIDAMQRDAGTLSRPRSSFGIPNLSERDYDFNYERIIKIGILLERLGANLPKEAWSFEDLAVSFIVIPGTNYDQEPTSGRDLTKYELFVELSNLLYKLEDEIKRYEYEQTHYSINISLLNMSRNSAENLSVKLEFEDQTRVGNFSLDSTKRSVMQNSNKIIREISLLPANDNIDLDEFVIHIPKNISETAFNIRITGRNLPEAQNTAMNIVIQ